MAGAVTAKKGTIKSKSYTVAGDTIEAILTDLEKKQIGGTDAVGDCTTAVAVPAISKFEEEENKKFKGKDKVEWFVTAKSGEVEMTGTITLPTLASDKNLSDKGKKEWGRFLKELTAHEDLHVEAAWAVAEEIAKELSEMKGTGQGKDKDAAIKAAEADFVKQYKAAYGGDKVAKRVTKAHAALDAKGNTFSLDANVEED
jgi:predicted secreted Zn-dependent protease